MLIFVTTGDNDWTNILINGFRSSDSIVPGLLYFSIFYVGYLFSIEIFEKIQTLVIFHIVSFLYRAVYVLLSLNVASIIYCFEDSDEHKMNVQEANYREVR